MKRAKLSLLFLITSCLLVFNSCKNEIIDFNTVSFLSATIDGYEEHTSLVAAVKTDTLLNVIAKLNGTELLTLGIKKPKVGTFEVVADNLLLSYGTDATYDNTYLASAGIVKITAMSSTSISGTFEFIGTNSKTGTNKTITSGVFKCNYK